MYVCICMYMYMYVYVYAMEFNDILDDGCRIGMN